MALRLMHVFVPAEKAEEMRGLLEGFEVVNEWRDSDSSKYASFHVLLQAEATEELMDRLEHQCGTLEGFRMVLLPVEAALPRLEPEPEPEAESEDDQEEVKRAKLRVSREELRTDAEDGVRISRIFVAMVLLSTIVAAIGLIRNDVAVLIGAMVIAPLLSPNIALALATTLGDTDLWAKSIRCNLVGFSLAVVLSVAIGFVVPIDPSTPALANRTHISGGDILLAMSAGAAGTLAFTTAVPGTLIGVMVAVALMPPLVTFGALLGAGYPGAAFGAFLLTLANVICVNLAGVGTFLLQGVAPRTWWEEERAKKARLRAAVLWTGLLGVLAVILWYTDGIGW